MKIDVKRLILILFLGLSLWYLSSPLLFKTGGVKVIAIDEKAKCGDLKIGDLITEVEGKIIKSEREFHAALSSVPSGRHVTMVVNDGPGGCIAVSTGELGIEVSGVRSKGFIFGSDLVGGEKILLSSKAELSTEEISYISDVLEKRFRVAGIGGSKISIDNKKIIIYAPVGSGIESLLINGRLEAVIEQSLKVANGTGAVKVGNETYDIFWDGLNITVEGSKYGTNESFDIGGVQFKLTNATNESAIVDALIFNNSDAKKTTISSGFVNYDTASRQYQFNVPIDLSQAASERFSRITGGLIPLYGIERELLSGMLIYYLDGEEITRLSIPSDMGGVSIKSISIIGGEHTMKDAINKKMLIDITLEGAIEKRLSIESVERFSGNLGWLIWFGEALLISSAVGIFAVGLIRYKSLKVGTVGAMIMGLEITYIFGIASISQSLLEFGWVIDANSLIGICMFSIISIVQIFLLSEKLLKRRFVKRYNHLVVLMFFAGFLTLFTPLNRIGLSLIVGLLIGTLLTKPVYIDFLSGLR